MELAGEIAEYYSAPGKQKKKITLVHGGERLLAAESWKPKFGKNLQGQLENLGVEVVLGEKVDIGERETGTLRPGKDQEFRLSNGSTVKGTLSVPC